MQGLIATLSGGSLELASHQEDEEQEDEEDSLQQVSSAPDMLPTQRPRMISEFSEEDLSKVRAAAREDHVATLRDQTAQSEDDEAVNEEVEDDGEEGQGLEEEHDDNSLVTRGVDTVAGHGTPNDVAGALELRASVELSGRVWLHVTKWN